MIRLSALLMPAALCAAASFALPSAADTELPVPHRVNAQLESSLDLLESLAKDGDSGAQLTLGQYLSGTAKTGADYERARKLLESAAAQGKGEAYTELARMYLEGRGVQKDTGKAVSLLESAAAKNDPEALYTIGMMRIEGKVLKRIRRAASGSSSGPGSSARRMRSSRSAGSTRKGRSPGRTRRRPSRTTSARPTASAATRPTIWGSSISRAPARKRTRILAAATLRTRSSTEMSSRKRP